MRTLPDCCALASSKRRMQHLLRATSCVSGHASSMHRGIEWDAVELPSQVTKSLQGVFFAACGASVLKAPHPASSRSAMPLAAGLTCPRHSCCCRTRCCCCGWWLLAALTAWHPTLTSTPTPLLLLLL